jgi:hypothetical protein
VKLGMQLEGSEHRDIPQGLKDRTIELVTKVYVAFETVVEAEVKNKVSNPLGFRNSNHGYSKGGMAFSGCLSFARFQFSASPAFCNSYHSST